MSRFEKKMKDKLDDEIKLAGLESLVREELEEHLISQLESLANIRGCAPGSRDVRGGEVWFENSTGSRGHSDPMDVHAVNSLSSGKGKGSSSPRDGCFILNAVEHNFNETAMHARTQASNRLARHGSRVRAKVRVKRSRENAKENTKVPKVPKARTRAKHRKLVSQVLKTRNQRQARKLRNLHRHVPLTLHGTMVGIVTNGTMAGVLMNGTMTGVLLDGTNVGNKRMTLLQALFNWRFGSWCHD